MDLSQLKGEYDAIFSLGDLCLASIQLKKHNLRPYSGVLDWMASVELSKVNELLENRFLDFLEYDNLRVIGYADTFICVSDDGYNLVSNHDFDGEKNTLTYLGGYAEVMEKYERRIQRFLSEMNNAKRILFVRTEGTLEDAAVLQDVLSRLVKHDFSVLLINHTYVQRIVEKSWPLEKICSIEFPNKDKWEGNHDLWREVLSGIRLRT
ncbi:Putative papain-like cysteine peptidase [Paenisporosarcina quisquiliarum]|nr:Putative papain-like cysteine peptidase [Paenisporosarcina quisquiliarum]